MALFTDKSDRLPKKQPNKAFVRFYSSTNLGDDLFIYILGQRYQNTFFTNRGVIRKTLHMFSNFKPSENVIESIKTRILARFFHQFRPISRRNERRADILIYVGGSIFQEGRSLAPWRDQRNAYQALNIPYYILGSNFGPYKTPEYKEIVADIITGSVDTCFRDLYSFREFSYIPTVRKSTDIAFSLDTSDFSSTANSGVALISIIDASWRFEASIAKRYEQEMANLALNLASEGFQVIFVSFCKKEGDEQSISRILKLIPQSDREKFRAHFYRGNLEAALQLFSDAEIVVGSRFHAVILGLIFNARVLPVAYSDKTIDILNDIGFQFPTVDIRSFGDFDGAVFNFDSIGMMNIDDQVQLSQTQFRELDKVLKRR